MGFLKADPPQTRLGLPGVGAGQVPTPNSSPTPEVILDLHVQTSA